MVDGLFPVGINHVELLDGLICAMLAAAATARARQLRAGFSGAVALGCLCGLLCPLLREALLHGQPGVAMALKAMPDNALIGAIFGMCAVQMLPAHAGRIFFWLDSASVATASCLGIILGYASLGFGGALIAGMAGALAPGLCRDAALGDTAMLVEKNWYAASIFTGCVGTICLMILGHLYLNKSASASNVQIWAFLGGSTVCIALMRWKGFEEH